MTSRKFLLGVLVGMSIAFVLMTGVAKYEDLNRRLSYVEGYLQQLDRMIRGGASHVVVDADRRAA